jgi:tetratricopeptide (TPR) repeat protein
VAYFPSERKGLHASVVVQRGKAATKCRFFASLRMTCHPERSEGSAFLRAPLPHFAVDTRTGVRYSVRQPGETMRPFPMKRRCLSFAACALLMLGRLSPAPAQQVRLEDAIPAEPSPDVYQRLPMSEAERTELREAMKARNYAQAEALLAGEIARQPKSPELLTMVGSVFFLHGKYLNCAVAMKKAEALAPLRGRERFTLAMSYIIINRRDWARPELEKLANQDPRSPLYVYWLGRIDYDAMQFKDAEAHFQKALNLNPKFMKAYDNLGLTYEALAQYDDAVRVDQQAVLMNRSDAAPSPWPPLNLGTLLIKLGRLPEAGTYLEESLKYDARFAKAHFQMGVLLEKQKKDEPACKELLEAVQYDPSYPEPHYLLGRIYTRQGNKQKADTEWQTFQKLKQQTPKEQPH